MNCRHMFIACSEKEGQAHVLNRKPVGYRKRKNEGIYSQLWHFGEDKREINAYMLSANESN